MRKTENASSPPAHATDTNTVVLIPTFNGKSLLEECLGSLRQQTYRRFHVIVVDDASTDDTVLWLGENFPEVKVLTLPHNVGFARAVNAGLRHALRVHSPRYIAVLNNDTKVESGWLEALVRRADTDPRIAAVTSNMFFANHPDIINSQGGTIDWNGDGYDINFGIKQELGKKEATRVFSACWGASLINTLALNEIGLLDEAFGAYFEDLDWSWRANILGYWVFFEKDAVVLHKHSMSYRDNQYRKLYLCKRNALRAALKNYEIGGLARQIFYILVGYWFALIGYFQTSKYKMTFLRKLVHVTIPFRALAWNVFHLPGTLKKRAVIQTHRKISDKEVAALIEHDATPVREWMKNLKRRWNPWHRAHTDEKTKKRPTRGKDFNKIKMQAIELREISGSRLQRLILGPQMSPWSLRLFSKMYLEPGLLKHLTSKAHGLYNALTNRPANSHPFEAALRTQAQELKKEETRRPFGVNIFGFLDSESGVGEAARSLVRAVRHVGVPYALVNSPRVPHRRRAREFAKEFTRRHPYPVNLIAIYGDMFDAELKKFGEKILADRYTVAYWAWELSRLPVRWAKSLDRVQEVWAPSTFVARAVREARPDIPVFVVPHTIWMSDYPYGRDHFDIPRKDFVFLFMFDFYSSFERKNPLAVIRAFKRAFTPSEPARLVVKCSNPNVDPENFARLKEAARGHHVHLIDHYLARNEVASLMNVADCYVSLHRSEGFGLSLAESMFFGKPVIATNYSGNVDFLNEVNGFPISYRLVDLTEDYGTYRKGNVWAEPSEEEATRAMRLVYEQSEVGNRKAMQGREDIVRSLGPDMVGRLVKQRLMEIKSIIQHA